MRLLAALLFVSPLLLPDPAAAAERILAFHSQITVREDGGMRVVETIRVAAEGQRIRHGIYRDFPTEYRDRMGDRYRVGFHVVSVQRDHRPEAYHLQRRTNGVRVYMGSRDTILRPGTHTYTLSYRTDRELGFFKDHDELYWNVTGNGWAFPIAKASASVSLPAAIPPSAVRMKAYTGVAGARGQAYQASQDAGGTVHFATTRPLGPHQGLTIVVSWPKGYVHEPTATEQIGYVLRDNRGLLAGLGGLALLLLYYLLAWAKVGRDPAAGVIIPRYEPPSGFSPAAMRYIRRMGYDDKTFAAALVDLAVKGCVKITQQKRNFVLERLAGECDRRAPGESALLNKLFADARRISLEQANHRRIKQALGAHERSLERNYEKLYFLTNSLYAMPGVFVSLVTIAGLVLLSPVAQKAQAAFMSFWLLVWTLGCAQLTLMAVRAWRSRRGAADTLRAVGIAAFAVPFMIFEGVGIYFLVQAASWTTVLIIVGAVGINWLFYQLLKAPTLAGRRLLDKIEGFRNYLEIAEKDELNVRHPVHRTPQLFEAYLPFALALDVEQPWAEKFADVLSTAGKDGRSYSPVWYSGSSWSSSHLGGFTGALGGALSSAISSSSTAPGASSGGGGFSGGGGGGGGGGGW